MSAQSSGNDAAAPAAGRVTGGLYSLFESRFPADRSATFTETPDGSVRTYGDLEEMAGRLANVLSANGVTKGDRVAVQVTKSPEALMLYLACLRAGAVFLPLNTAYKPSEIAYFLDDAEPAVFVCDPAAPETLAEVLNDRPAVKVLTLAADGSGTLASQASSQSADFATVPMAGDDLAAILYTSGTTGRPKGAMLTQQNLASNAMTLHEAWGFEPGDVLLHILPLFHTHGLFVAASVALLNGSAMLFISRFDPDDVVRLLPRATVMMAVPTHYVRLLGHDGFTREAARSMRLFTSGSAPLLAETFKAFEARTGHAILERCGMTETGMNLSNPLEGDRIPGTVGVPLPGIEVKICDEGGQELPAGTPGSLEVRGPNVFKGYWRKPEKTEAEFRADGFFITGDIAVKDERGYVSIVGREKDLIISGGYNVYPKEVELVIDDLAGVDESAVIGLPHPDFGEAVAAVITRTDDGLAEDTVVQHVKTALANYKVPKRVIFVDALPRNTMGKVQKNVLRDTYKSAFTA